LNEFQFLSQWSDSALYFHAKIAILETMGSPRAFSDLIDRLKQSGLRPTRQRLALARILFGQGNRHATAEQLHAEAMSAEVRVSLATVYNTLHQFTKAGLLREVVVEPGRSYFDTNVDDHHHFYYEASGQLEDIPGERIRLADLPNPPEGQEIARVDVILRVAPRD